MLQKWWWNWFLYHSLYPYEVIFLNGRYCICDARRAKFYDLMKVSVSMGTTKADAIKVTVHTGAYSHRVIGTGWVSISQIHHILLTGTGLCYFFIREFMIGDDIEDLSLRVTLIYSKELDY